MAAELRLPVGLLVAALGAVIIWPSVESMSTGETGVSGSQVDSVLGLVSGLCFAAAGVLMIRNSWKAPVADEPERSEPDSDPRR